MIEEEAARMKVVAAISTAVMNDLLNRGGIRQVFDSIDEEIMDEIREAIGTAALDALHGIARVVPIEATKAMIKEAHSAWDAHIYDGIDYGADDTFRVMAERGDLTKGSE
jgi:hypothetical protein